MTDDYGKLKKCMKFKKGDKVEIIDDAIRGEILSIEGNTITITTDDGFNLQVSASEIIKTEDETLKISNIDVFRGLKEKQPSKRPKPKAIKREKQQPAIEVDLHIHQLTASTRGMSNHDMLNLQIDTAKRQLEFAINKRIQRVVFIHGVGEGVLKTELEYLFGRYGNISYYDADYQKYGLGATEVYIHQNQIG